MTNQKLMHACHCCKKNNAGALKIITVWKKNLNAVIYASTGKYLCCLCCCSYCFRRSGNPILVSNNNSNWSQYSNFTMWRRRHEADFQSHGHHHHHSTTMIFSTFWWRYSRRLNESISAWFLSIWNSDRCSISLQFRQQRWLDTLPSYLACIILCNKKRKVWNSGGKTKQNKPTGSLRTIKGCALFSTTKVKALSDWEPCNLLIL